MNFSSEQVETVRRMMAMVEEGKANNVVGGASGSAAQTVAAQPDVSASS